MIKTMSYYKYIINLKVKFLSKQYLYCFFFNIFKLNIKERGNLYRQLNVYNINFLVVKNLISKTGIFIPSFGEYLLIYTNNILNTQIFEQFNLNCLSVAFKGYFLNNIYYLNLNNLNIFFSNNFMFFISYFLYVIYIYLNFLHFFNKSLGVYIKKIQLNLCK